MKRLMLALILGICCYVSAQQLSPQPQLNLPCKVLSVHDGDTLTASVTIYMKVRLIDCWAPEINKPLQRRKGLKSKAKLQELALGKYGMLTIPLFPDDFGDATSLSRINARLIIDGKDISAQMVESGHATKEKQK